jgi:hypothetical protein
MWHLQAFLSLPPAERRALLYAFGAVAVIRLGLWLLPFDLLRRRLERPVRLAARPLPPERVAWCVEVAGRYVPGATCLAQALAARLLLRQHGCDPELRIGVARGASGALEAHAWVEIGGRVVVGGPAEAVQRFTILPSME